MGSLPNLHELEQIERKREKRREREMREQLAREVTRERERMIQRKVSGKKAKYLSILFYVYAKFCRKRKKNCKQYRKDLLNEGNVCRA